MDRRAHTSEPTTVGMCTWVYERDQTRRACPVTEHPKKHTPSAPHATITAAIGAQVQTGPVETHPQATATRPPNGTDAQE